ncbi:hypothetical protein COV19_06230 [Candidatus Woesearchaeota archaeon CG10_big_fil_rev_8_21_14_0_10_44_13]|nr:MAG: hypothetical protein COV19_06230 [Candidatus Woesearchaeota archaeon CG10_big_fil_rev_8_21_14_0_10_44_13]
MTNFDKDLIFLYSENARIKLKDLANMLKKSPQRLKYGLKHLENEGIVNNPFTIIDYSFFGLILFRVYFKGGYISEGQKEDILKKLGENPSIVSIYELSGEFDLAIEMSSPNPSRFNKELKKVIDLIPTLNNYKIILNLVSHIYPRGYLAENPSFADITDHDIIVGGDRVVEEFSNDEMAIMKSLLNNPKIRLSSLAKQSGMNVKTAVSILKSLRKRRIVKGFKHVIDTNRLDINKFRLFLKLHNVSKEREDQLMAYLMKTREVINANKTVGDWDLEVDMESLDKIRIRRMILQLREEFKDLIETFNIIEFYSYYKKAYLPQYLFAHDKGETKTI